MMDKIALCTLGHLESGDPADLGQHLGELARRYPHLDIWGDCCGTWDTHLAEIASNVVEALATSAETEAAGGQSSADLRV